MRREIHESRRKGKRKAIRGSISVPLCSRQQGCRVRVLPLSWFVTLLGFTSLVLAGGSHTCDLPTHNLGDYELWRWRHWVGAGRCLGSPFGGGFDVGRTQSQCACADGDSTGAVCVARIRSPPAFGDDLQSPVASSRLLVCDVAAVRHQIS